MIIRGGTIEQIACAARLGDLDRINFILDGAEQSDAVIRGRAQADRMLRRDAPLPALVEPMELASINPNPSPKLYGTKAA